MSDTVMIEQAEPDRADADRSPTLSRYALWTRSQREPLVRAPLARNGFDVVLPSATSWTTSHSRGVSGPGGSSDPSPCRSSVTCDTLGLR